MLISKNDHLRESGKSNRSRKSPGKCFSTYGLERSEQIQDNEIQLKLKNKYTNIKIPIAPKIHLETRIEREKKKDPNLMIPQIYALPGRTVCLCGFEN